MNIIRLEHTVQRSKPESEYRDAHILRLYSDVKMGYRVVVDDGGLNRHTEKLLAEICRIVNAHNALVAQRDALRDAAEASLALSQHLAVCDAFDVPDGKCKTCLELGAKMRSTRGAALVLVAE